MFDKLRPKLLGDEEERAVSPVIGVILMVAVTVILAAVIAGALMGMGDSIGDTPTTANAEVNVNSGYDNSSLNDSEEIVYISHSSGDSIDQDNVQVNLRSEDGAPIVSLTDESDQENITIDMNNEDFNAGSTITVESTDDGDSPEDYPEELENGETIVVQLVDTQTDTTVVDTEVDLPE